MIVDLREKGERDKHGAIPGALHMPYPSPQGQMGMLHELATAAGKRVLFYCAFGERSAMAVRAARDAGVETAFHIDGGIDAWKKADGPIVS
jgi:sulfur dioxygenase